MDGGGNSCYLTRCSRIDKLYPLILFSGERERERERVCVCVCVYVCVCVCDECKQAAAGKFISYF